MAIAADGMTNLGSFATDTTNASAVCNTDVSISGDEFVFSLRALQKYYGDGKLV